MARIRSHHEGVLRVLAVDDERPALEELTYLLRADSRVEHVVAAGDGGTALRHLDAALADGQPLAAVFLDIRMPGLDGLVVARVLSRFAEPPQVVFVTAYDDFAVEAFELNAIDYLLKPVRAERLEEAIRRVVEARGGPTEVLGTDPDETLPVELGGVTRFIRRADIRYVEAQGDYARLHTAEGSHLIRVPLAALEERWRDAGFLRVHRSHLVAVAHIDELRMESGRVSVRIGTELIPVSRRCTRELRDRLVRQARPDRPLHPGGRS
jgi:two-component system response regulator LytT